MAANPLLDVPGLGGYLAAQQMGEQQLNNQLQRAATIQTLQQHYEAQQQQAALRNALAQSGGDADAALTAALKSGNVAAAHQLAPLVKIAQDRRDAEELRAGVRAVNNASAAPAATPTATIAPDVPTDNPADASFTVPTAQTVAAPSTQQRISNLQRLSETYAKHPQVVQRIASEIDRLQKDSEKAPQVRTRISGETSIQEEFRNGQWTEIGRGPRFAKQVVNVNAPSQEPLSKEAVRDLAIQSLYDPNATSGYRRDTTAMSRIANERQRVMQEAGITSEDVVSGRAGFKADTLSLNKLTPQYDAITAFEKTAIRNGQMLKELGDKVDTTGVPVVERWIRSGRKAVQGDEDVAKFHAQMNLYRAEAARILTQPTLSGVLTDTARKEMGHVLDDNASAKQIRSVVDLLERDFHNRRGTLEEQISSIRARMRGRVAPGSGAEAPQPQPQPAAASQTDPRAVALPDGRVKTFPTPAAAAAFRREAGL